MGGVETRCTLKIDASVYAQNAPTGFCATDYHTRLSIQNLAQRGPDEAAERPRRGGPAHETYARNKQSDVEKSIFPDLEIRHNPELVDLFLVHLPGELIGCVANILRCGNCTADNEHIGTGLLGVPGHACGHNP